ncbi:rhomboid family intramembrane serine protease [Candidatus Marinimicrobia bacterium]|jgi:membrane associated rhomboid family serine protease|nr:rhomboid family intramembrane serine protease [Candidatus Neomarinimicrobiota bacterium]|tara:strand:- start:2597 stop:3250 length:654 start_codon:yes stop_codon:yes gene_type:complete
MLFPYKDNNPRVLYPFITFGIIFLNLIFFLGQFYISSNDSQLGIKIISTFGFIPHDFNLLTVFSSMFLHGGIGHLVGNMWFLYIFGDNVESILGHVKYFLFYLMCGIAAAFGQYIINPSSLIPMIGASGAIAGILGAYMISFPKAKVHVFVMLFVFFTTLIVPAKIVLGIWFLIQLNGGISEFGVLSKGGIAWFAHIGGFLAGVIFVKAFQTFELKV